MKLSVKKSTDAERQFLKWTEGLPKLSRAGWSPVPEPMGEGSGPSPRITSLLLPSGVRRNHRSHTGLTVRLYDLIPDRYRTTCKTGIRGRDWRSSRRL